MRDLGSEHYTYLGNSIKFKSFSSSEELSLLGENLELTKKGKKGT